MAWFEEVSQTGVIPSSIIEEEMQSESPAPMDLDGKAVYEENDVADITNSRPTHPHVLDLY